jgi:hypothetical protein
VEYELAQVNVARMLAPLDDPRLAAFVDALEPVNAQADAAPGFVWRLQTEDGNATAIGGFEADAGDSAGMIVNMSVWLDVESLAAFVYGPMHREILRRRREWFLPMTEAYTACWWVPAGSRPTVAEAETKVHLLRSLGPTPESFTLGTHFGRPGRAGSMPLEGADDWLCRS